MIGLIFYKTYGSGCEHFWFRKERNHLYQRVVRWGIFYWPAGALINEHDCNYCREGG